MTDSDIVREAMTLMHPRTQKRRQKALAALDRLVADPTYRAAAKAIQEAEARTEAAEAVLAESQERPRSLIRTNDATEAELNDLRGKHDRLMDSYTAMEAERDEWKAEALHHNAEEIRLREALDDFAQHGTRFDCNPTVQTYNTPEWVASQEWWQNRAVAMDVAVRNRARAALAAPTKEGT